MRQLAGGLVVRDVDHGLASADAGFAEAVGGRDCGTHDNEECGAAGGVEWLYVRTNVSGGLQRHGRVLRRMVESEQEAAEKTNRMQTMLTPENYDMELEGEQTVDGVHAWVLRVQPKVENKFTYRGRVWVSEDDYAVVRVQGEPAKSPSWWISKAGFDWRYARHGEFWLPEKRALRRAMCGSAEMQH